jgi:lipoprotein-releasing system permease protein
VNNWNEILKIVENHPEVRAASPYVNGQGMISLSESVQGVMVRGVLPDGENRLTDFGNKFKKGKLDDLRAGEFGIVLGVDLARALGAHLGEKVLLITPQGQITPTGLLPRLKQFRVVGIFEIGMAPYDNALALIHIADAQKLYRMGEAVTGISARLHDLDHSRQVANQLDVMLPREDFATDWTRQNANYFSVVAMEKKMMFIILSLIVLVAAFNIVSTLVMAVTDKQSDIAILRTLGASPSSIMKIFMVQGVLIGTVGLLIGVIGGVLIALNIGTIVPFIEHLFGVQFLAKEFYFINELPSDLQRMDVIVVASMSLFISLFATLYPSWRAAQTQPAEALRYE